MARINENFNKLQGSYLFAEISRRVEEYSAKNPDTTIIKLGIGDVTRPLPRAVLQGIEQGVREQGKADSFHGYGPYEGYAFLREAIASNDYQARGIDIKATEIFVSTGAKEDTANFQELFAADSKIAITDPVYPVYLDSNVMAGRTGQFREGRFEGVVYLDCTQENDFCPALPAEKVELIYLCFPNNPTGKVLTKAQLKTWVAYAREKGALILYDAAYEAFISDPDLPRSIYEIEGAREVAVEFRSLSKTAGFTGTRCAYTVIPDTVLVQDQTGKQHQLNQLWLRRQSTKFNGVSYPIQTGAAAVFTPEGQKQVRETIAYYMENARIIREGLDKLEISYSGGVNAPYIWFRVPGGMDSWAFFTLLLEQCQVVGTPGVGFGKCGDGYFRLTAFGSRENIEEAVARLSQLEIPAEK